jgi:hypothetical protein
MFTIVSSVFQVFLQMFEMQVSNVSFVFRRMLQVLHLDVSKLDRVLHLPPRLLLSRLGVRCGKRAQAEAVSDGAGGPHVHVQQPRACSRMQHAKQQQEAWVGRRSRA